MPTSRELYNNRRPEREKPTTSRHAKCEICRDQISDLVDAGCIHTFCRKCLTRFNMCPICGMDLHERDLSTSSQHRDHTPDRPTGNFYRIHDHDSMNMTQATVTTVTETTQTTTKIIPCEDQPRRIYDNNNSRDRVASGNNQLSEFEDRSRVVQKTLLQVQVPQRAPSPTREVVGEAIIDFRQMYPAMIRKSREIRHNDDRFEPYLILIRDVLHSWKIALQTRDGFSMLKRDFLTMCKYRNVSRR